MRITSFQLLMLLRAFTAGAGRSLVGPRAQGALLALLALLGYSSVIPSSVSVPLGDLQAFCRPYGAVTTDPTLKELDLEKVLP